eukprot:6213077-Pleurochrysis_carterae.AAC.2
MPATTNAGDILSYDIYYASVPHVPGGQRYVIKFHDHYSTLNTPYELRSTSTLDLFSSLWCSV